MSDHSSDCHNICAINTRDDIDASNTGDLTRAEREGREQLLKAIEAMNHLPPEIISGKAGSIIINPL